jgi:acetyl esterase/lipase
LNRTTVVYRQVQGHDIHLDVYRPKGDDLCPVIVNIHGGGLIMGHREEVDRKLLTLAEEQGYAVVSLDYRLAPETKLPDIISDIEAAFSWIGSSGESQFHIDPHRMIVVGSSAGGYLTLVTGYRVDPQPRALVAFYGYGELNAEWYASPSLYPAHNLRKVTREDALAEIGESVISDGRLRSGDGEAIYLYFRQNGLWPREVSGFEPDSIVDRLTPYEPVKNVTRDFPPTLLVHGALDTDVPHEESAAMANQFAKHGVPHIFKTIDKGEHEFIGGDQAQIDDAYSTMTEFAIRYLGPAASPALP